MYYILHKPWFHAILLFGQQNLLLKFPMYFLPGSTLSILNPTAHSYQFYVTWTEVPHFQFTYKYY